MYLMQNLAHDNCHHALAGLPKQQGPGLRAHTLPTADLNSLLDDLEKPQQAATQHTGLGTIASGTEYKDDSALGQSE